MHHVAEDHSAGSAGHGGAPVNPHGRRVESGQLLLEQLGQIVHMHSEQLSSYLVLTVALYVTSRNSDQNQISDLTRN